MNATLRAIALPCVVVLATACSQARAEPPFGKAAAASEPPVAVAAAAPELPAGVFAVAPQAVVRAAAAVGAPPSEPSGECKGGLDADDDGARVDVKVGAAPTRGAADAPVTVVVFSDFQCPFCSRTTPLLEELAAAHPGKVRVAFKNKPLPMHPNARLAAKAALAADEQAKFWPMHDLLVQHAGPLGRADLERYAASLGLDGGRFSTALDDARLEARVDADVREADAAGVKGTPTVFVNGRRITGARGKEHFAKVIDDELRAR